MDKQIRRFYDFGAFRLDTQNHRLMRGDGEIILLTPKEFEVLLTLIGNAGNVVAKDALLDAVWKDAFVSEETLTRNVSWLRKKLGGEKFIETVPKLGYRFAAQVTASDAPDLIIEEQTVQHIRVEETLTLSDDETVRRKDNEKKFALPPSVPSSHRLTVSSSLLFAFGVLAVAAIGFVVYQNYFQKPAPKIVFASRVVPFAGLPGIEAMPAFSPDSKQIVFGWNGGESEILDIYVKIIGTGEPVRLTTGKTNAFFPVFSPDGRNIAFFRSSPETSKIFLISALGGAERKICDVQSGGTSFSFSPDGKTIATADRDAETAANGIFFVDVETGAKTRLSAPPENFNDNAPRFSPDGKSIAFTEQNQDINIWRYEVNQTGIQNPPRKFIASTRDDHSPQISPDGSRVAFVSHRTGESAIWTAAADNSNPLRLAAGHSPKFSSDGKHIVFVAPNNNRNEMYLVDTEGGSPRALLADSSQNDLPAWSADGRWIYFRPNRGGDYNLWKIASDGTGSPVQITKQGAFESFAAPDGKTIYYSKDRETGGLWRVSAIGNAETSDEAPVAELAEAGFRRSWTIAAAGIFFVARAEQPPYKIKFYDFSTNQIREIATTDTAPILDFAGLNASPDGRTIFYAQYDQNASSIMIAELGK